MFAAISGRQFIQVVVGALSVCNFWPGRRLFDGAEAFLGARQWVVLRQRAARDVEWRAVNLVVTSREHLQQAAVDVRDVTILTLFCSPDC